MTEGRRLVNAECEQREGERLRARASVLTREVRRVMPDGLRAGPCLTLLEGPGQAVFKDLEWKIIYTRHPDIKPHASHFHPSCNCPLLPPGSECIQLLQQASHHDLNGRIVEQYYFSLWGFLCQLCFLLLTSIMSWTVLAKMILASGCNYL